MREIKFKAKRVDNGKWVYGDLIKQYNGYCISNDDIEIELDEDYWENSYGYPPSASDFHLTNIYEVIPETICQFTTLKDKNGVEIYRDDKFQYRKHKWYLLDDFIGVVKFKDGCFGYECNRNRLFTPFGEFDELQEDFLNHIEIIGNIHDKQQQKQALIDMMRADKEIGLYDDNPKNH